MEPLIARSPMAVPTHLMNQSTSMKASFLRVIAVLAALSALGHAQTINWGSEVLSDLRKSNGGIINQSGFQFELGAFNPGFEPSPGNLANWFLNWHVYNTADYSKEAGYFTSPVQMQDNGSFDPALGAYDFQGLEAYLWIRNSPTMVRDRGNEWLLVRASDWKFPEASPGCCDNALPLEWSVSDLGAGDVPLFGAQGGVQANFGTRDYDLPSTLQTYTLGASQGDSATPEPGAFVLVLVLGLMALLDRRRAWSH